MLMATGIFDTQMTDQAPCRIYYEQYVGESDSTVAVTSETVAASNPLGAFVNLANKMIQFGTMVVTNAAASTTYVEGTDYVIDYVNGKLEALSGGAITAGQSLRANYTFDAIRKGEMAPIAHGKMQTLYKTLDIQADRLAMQISREAVVFSRSQLGYDALNRTLMRLVEAIARRIDRGLFTLALTQVTQVANNSGGTWTVASDSLDSAVQKVGTAKVKVQNRFYSPDAIVMSVTNSDRLSNWNGFGANGLRPDGNITEQGFVFRLKGVPVFASPLFPDSIVLVTNRELVMHRVFQTMELRGPYQSNDSSGNMIAADQYYVEEFNGSDFTLQNKGSYIKVA